MPAISGTLKYYAAFEEKWIRISFEKNEVIIHVVGDNYEPWISEAILTIDHFEKCLKGKSVPFITHYRRWGGKRATNCIRIKIAK